MRARLRPDEGLGPAAGRRDRRRAGRVVRVQPGAGAVRLGLADGAGEAARRLHGARPPAAGRDAEPDGPHQGHPRGEAPPQADPEMFLVHPRTNCSSLLNT